MVALPKEHKNYEGCRLEALAYKETEDYLTDEAALGAAIPGLPGLMRRVQDRAEGNTPESFANDVLDMLGAAPEDYAEDEDYPRQLSKLWDNIFARLFISNTPGDWIPYLCRALAVLSLVKTHADDAETPIWEYSRAQIFMPGWLFEIAVQNTGADETVDQEPNPQPEIDRANIAKRLYALDELYECRKYADENGKMDADKLDHATRTVLQNEELIDENDQFDWAEAADFLRRDLRRRMAARPDVLGHHYAVRVGDTVLETNAACMEVYEDGDPCMQSTPAALNWKPATGFYSAAFWGDLMVTRQFLVKYMKGEVAHVETAVKNTKKVRIHRRLDRTEISEFFEREESEEQERESQSTDRHSMEREVMRALQQDMNLQAGINLSGQLGPLHMESSAGFGYGVSSQSLNQETTSFSREVTERALNRIKKRVRESKTITTIQEIEETAENTLDNTAAPSDHINGVYRWLDKLYLNKVYNYGKRLMFEFMVPEPANFFLFRNISAPDHTDKVIKPIHPGLPHTDNMGQVKVPLLTFDSVTEGNYAYWTAYYGVTDIQPPPELYQWASKALTMTVPDPEGGEYKLGIAALSDESLQIPQGYKAERAYVQLRAMDIGEFAPPSDNVTNPNWLKSARNTSLVVQIGKSSRIQHYFDKDGYITGNSNGFYNINWTNDPNAETSSEANSYLPVTCKLMGRQHELHAIINIEVRFERMESTLTRWKMQTYAAILAGYERQKAEYEQWLSRQRMDASPVQGNNPRTNRLIEREELKKRCIELFSGQRFESFDAAVNGIYNQSGYPEIRFEESVREGVWVKYFEQVFDWSNMNYVLYPYHYGRKPNWKRIKALRDNDPPFERFLHAGYARVVVPVRPGFERYTFPWGPQCWANGQDPAHQPLGENPNLLDIWKEIKDQLDVLPQDLDDAQHLVGTYLHAVPTNLVYLVGDAEASEDPDFRDPLPDYSDDPGIAPYLPTT